MATGSVAQPVIIAKKLGKRFKLYDRRWGRLAEWLSGGQRVRHTDFWALRDIGFEVQSGECLGVIGPNGSGKSTLLKILTGAMSPTEGEFSIRGRVMSLLELGTGLNPELSGRANIGHMSSLLSFPPDYAHGRMNDIEAFAELGEFFDRPVKTYSSGMTVRLAFSMFAFFEPDVFIVDEALSVGDIFFQQKCVRRIEAMLDAGVTMLFVSHDMAMVQRLCDRAMLLVGGRTEFAGPPEECVSRYYSSVGSRRGSPVNAGVATPSPQLDETVRHRLLRHNILPMARARHGGRRLELLAATLQNQQGEHVSVVPMLSAATIQLLLKAHEPIATPSAGIHLYDRLNNLIFAAGTRQLHVEMPPMQADEERLLTLTLELRVQPGEYTFSLGCSEAAQEGPDVGFVHDRHEGLGPITVVYDGEGVMPFYGMAQLPLRISVGDGRKNP